MSSKRNLVISGALAAIIAVALVSGVITLGILNTSTSNQHSSSESASIEKTSVSAVTATSQIQSSSIQENSASTGQTGNLAVLMTDPPTVPDGVTAVYVTYSNLAIHVSGAGNQTGWQILNSSGEINLMAIINATQTIAEANVTDGTFNALAFNVTSAVVTFEGGNYTAALVYQNHVLFVPIVGGISVINGQMSATVIDMTPTVLRLDNQTNPTFVFIPEARAYTIPAQSIGGLNLQVGGKDDIRAAPWWLAILHSAKYEITNVNLNATHISITIANTGNVSLVFKIAVLLSPTSVSGGRIPIASLGSILGTSEVFVLEHNDSMSPITEINNGVPAAMIAAGGYLLQPGATVSFSFSGNLSLGVALSNTPIHHLRPINPGQRYVIALLANGMVAATTIVAAAS